MTESKLRNEPGVGPREIDIAVEAEADGDSVVISLQVNQKRGPASVEWVEQQIDLGRVRAGQPRLDPLGTHGLSGS